MKKGASVILHNIRSSHNVGSMFRTGDAFGIGKIYFTGYTPAPKDKFGRPSKEIAKVALGAEQSVTWEVFGELNEKTGSLESVLKLIKKLKKEGTMVVAVEQATNSIDYKKVKLVGPTAFIVGNEIDGLDQKILDLCDVIAEIPMKGEKESLNVSVAFGIALARILNI